MPPSIKALPSALEKLLHSVFIPKHSESARFTGTSFTSNNVRSGTQQVRKRHWALGSAVVLAGCWITHSTMATIVNEHQLLPTPQTAHIAGEDNTQGLEVALNIAATVEQPTTEVVQPAVYTEKQHKIRRGETLGSIFKKLDLGHQIPHYISKHDEAKRLTSLSVGKQLTFRFDEDKQLAEIRYPDTKLSEFVVRLNGTQIDEAVTESRVYNTVEHSVSGQIKTSLYDAAIDAGLSTQLVMDMVQIFGWDIDFAQDLRKGDSFHLVFSDHRINGNKIADGEILAAEFTTQGHTYRAIRFEQSDGTVSYYTPEGDSMLGTFLRSPVEFSRISSRFGRRIHPISKKWKAHRGVDYAASRGTPIRATADGKVVHAGRKGGYGKTIVLRHAGRFSTLYAHMNGYAKGVKSGSRVKQGQIIGYVGSTGMSTGPHLHYEFRVDGVHRNPLTYKTPKASSVPEEQKAEFFALTQSQLAKLDTARNQYAAANTKTSATGH